MPSVNILAEFPVTWLDKNVKTRNTAAAASAYLEYLYTPQAQKIITDYYYRVQNPTLMAQYKERFPQTRLLRVEQQFGSWPQVMKTHFASGGELDKLQGAVHQ